MRSAADTTFAHVRFISAGAGSGKTYRLTEELERALVNDGIAPERVIGTTFTVKAAGELRGRVRARLIESGRPELAEQMGQALIGTVHAVCERLLARFAFELGLSPQLHVLALEDGERLFRQALDEVLDIERVRAMNALATALELEDAEGRLAWQKHVRDVADAARSNDITAASLRAMGVDSARELIAFLPEPGSERNLDESFSAAVKKAADGMPADPVYAVTRRYAELVRSAMHALRRQECSWRTWMRLAQERAGKRDGTDRLAAAVRAVAAEFERHPRFRRDVERYIEGVFEIAAESLERFAATKRERGLIDFSDMEQWTLHALNDVAVVERLQEELDLLLVDEFQDTNPMQLALFMKLARCAKKVIFVGDVKQAIYAFRGCDPDLVFSTLEGLTARGGIDDVLEHSYRSRPPLVAYVNAVFAAAFAKDGIPASRVTLESRRPEMVTEPALIRWSLQGDKAVDCAAALARAIAELVSSGYRVVDPADGRARPVRFGDIAVLAATNPHVEDIARALRARRVPMKMTIRGLLETPEICLAMSCLRRMNDSRDTLATAEIMALSSCTEPEIWLAERLRWLVGNRESFAWGEDTHPVLVALRRLRDQVAAQSPVEIVARVLNYVGIREQVTRWGPDAVQALQRQRNLDAFLDLAVQYERHCEAQHEAATLTGFLFWVAHPVSAELDLQPVVTTGDAVHVVTYHRAKGLEWPVVIATDFYRVLPTRLYEARVEHDAATFDPARPLDGRKLRFWPNMFPERAGLPLQNAMLASPAGERARRLADSEARRLAYVGMTRARDLLVIALPDREPPSGSWLESFACEWLLPSDDSLELPHGACIPTRAATYDAARDHVPRAPFSPRWFAERVPLDSPLPEILNPSRLEAVVPASIREMVQIGSRIALEEADITALGNALHALIAAELVNPGGSGAAARARALLEAHDTARILREDDALAAARRFRAWIRQRFAPRETYVEYPVSSLLEGGQVVKGWIDVLLETREGWVIIDHKSSPRPIASCQDEVQEHAAQLRAYADALRASGHIVRSTWLHFPVTGMMVEVGFP